jgi:5'-nucleotidase
MKYLRIASLVVIVALCSCAKDRPALPAPRTVSAAEKPSYIPRSVSSGDFTVLISNDDGYDAPGIRALIGALGSVARVVVAAPAREQSGKGHSLTLREPIFVTEHKQLDGATWYSIDAPPATCVRLAIESLLPERPHVVVSGINRGDNLGATVYHSGTVGAAREAAIIGIPAIAVSIRGEAQQDYEAAATFVRDLISHLRSADQLKPELFLNVNVPAGKRNGVRLARLSVKPRHDTFERRGGPRGQLYFWPDWTQLADDQEGTDVWAFVRGYITVTPMQLDVTNTRDMAVMRTIETNIVAK